MNALAARHHERPDFGVQCRVGLGVQMEEHIPRFG
jgi:hypothetical protein